MAGDEVATSALRAELDHWRASRRTARVWIRDDDAVETTPQLDRFIGLLERQQAPALFAVIPSHLQANLVPALTSHDGLFACVHGWAHANHARPDSKTCEYGPERRLQDVDRELTRGREIVLSGFGARAVDMFVPPWNRIDTRWLPRVAAAGFAAISTHGERLIADASSGLCVRNAHVDIMDWRGGRVGRPLNHVARTLADELCRSRMGAGHPVALLTHHLVHDERANAVLEEILALLSTNSAVEWLLPNGLIRDHAQRAETE